MTSAPTALCQPAGADAAYQLRYAWTGWPSRGSFFARDSVLERIEQTNPHWERDSWRVWEYHGTDGCVQILFSTTPEITPIFVAQRAKGRPAYALRSAGIRIPFSRKVAVRSVGDNTRRDVEAYLERQVAKEQFVDPQFAQRTAELTVVNPAVDLSQPTPRSRGRYWYNLHLVLVVEQHARLESWPVLTGLRAAFLRIADRTGHAVARLSVMLSHLHAALRAEADTAPLEIAFCYQNNLAHLLRL